jgi:spoIIIJ-associated protein
MSKKKFFSGNSLRQALLAAAAHFDLPPDEVAYREVEKKHGFLKTRKRVVIEVDGEDPRRPPAAPEAAAAEEQRGEPIERGEAAESGAGEPATDPSPGRPPRLPRGEGEERGGGAGDRTRPSRGRRREAGGEEAEPPAAAVSREVVEEPEAATPDAAAEERAAAAPARRRSQPGRVAAAAEAPARPSRRRAIEEAEPEEEPEEAAEPWEGGEEEGEEPTGAVAGPAGEEEAAEGRRRRRRRRGGRGRAAGGERAAGGDGGGDDLVALPERPRRPSERFAEARGPLADATRDALDRVLDLAGLDLGYTVLQGDDRLEIDLSGGDESLLVAEGGELLRAIEHLVPRMVRTLSGEPVNVRVDAADFHEIHEEQLRTLAQRMASEVRRSERPRTLEPLSPADRRIVHITLADEPRVTSMSEGTGYFKRIVVKPA